MSDGGLEEPMISTKLLEKITLWVCAIAAGYFLTHLVHAVAVGSIPIVK
jgi:hypothetical protein